MAEAPLPRLPPKSPFLRLVRIAPPASAAAGLEPCGAGSGGEARSRPGGSSPLGRSRLSATDAPIDKSVSMSQPLGNGNTPYRGVALIKVYFK